VSEPAAAPAAPLIGQVLNGTYRLVRAVGEGGINVVATRSMERLEKQVQPRYI